MEYVLYIFRKEICKVMVAYKLFSYSKDCEGKFLISEEIYLRNEFPKELEIILMFATV